jgi:hypothetical protein
MGILNKLKDVSGIGLGAQEQYVRAFEKGVFLQPPDYAAASKHFMTANEKFEKEGNTEMAKRAKANSCLYELASAKSTAFLSRLTESLRGIMAEQNLPHERCLLPNNHGATARDLSG